jgi:23S rRNA (uracil1939-C5)-methyltransferase
LYFFQEYFSNLLNRYTVSFQKKLDSVCFTIYALLTMKILSLEAVKWVNNGYCIGYHSGNTYFISGAIPGESVECEVVFENSKFRHAITRAVLQSSAGRVEPACPFFLECGGCSFRHIQYSDEVCLKKNLLTQEIKYHHDIDTFYSYSEKYRNNVQVKIDSEMMGFFKEDTNQVIDLKNVGCKNLPDELNAIFFSNKKTYQKEIRLRLDSEGVKQYKDYQSIFTVLGKNIVIPPDGFFQINRYLLSQWIEHILLLVPEDTHSILELFCGSGTLSLFLAERCTGLVGYEIDTQAVLWAKTNCENNRLTNTQFYTYDLYQKKLSLNQTFGLWVMNPPRKGLGIKVIESILSYMPQYIIYSSCNYTSLSQDLKKLGIFYNMVTVSIFDFFPRTKYFETLVFLKRR